MIEPQALIEDLNCALNDSRRWARGMPQKLVEFEQIRDRNALRSARFLSDVAKKIDTLINRDESLCLKHINVDEDGKKEPGEWLLDAIWTRPVLYKQIARAEDTRINEDLEISAEVVCAIESESSTTTEDFFIDISKLVVLSAETKIFAAGLNHKTQDGANNYSMRRIHELNRLLDCSPRCNEDSEWYVAFWPSPAKLDNSDEESIWIELDNGSSELEHLTSIRLFHRRHGEDFAEVNRERTL